jgi:gliding motility-associated-like protein
MIKSVKTRLVLKLVVLMLLVSGIASELNAQTAIAIGPQMATFTSMVRGYTFTAPGNFTICGLFIPTDASTGVQSVEIVRFTNAAPPAWPGTTNAFTSLFYNANNASNAMIPCNVSVSNGDIMGIYGARGTNMVNSYDGINYVTTINGNNATLSRSGMQANLSTQQMANIWAETQFRIGRIIMYINCCPTPPAPSGPITTNAGACIGAGDTLTFTIPWDPQAVSYEWTVPNGDSIVSGQGDSSIVVALGPNASSGQICVSLEDTCTTSSSICYSYTVNQPNPPYAGPNRIVCLGESVTLGAIAPNIGQAEWHYVSAPLNNFGTISDSLDQNAIFTASQPGTHVLEWVVTSAGCPQVSDMVEVEVIPIPTAGFSFEEACEGSPMQFQDESNGNGTSIGSLYWDMNSDGIYDHYGDSPAHNYQDGGTFPVTLVATNLGCSDTITQNVTVWAQPDVLFTASPVCDGEEVEFSNQTTLINGNIDSLTWSFGDGSGPQLSLAPNLNLEPNHLYGQYGDYAVSLRIVTDQGCSDIFTDSVHVYDNPVANFSVDNACQFQTTVFNDQSSVNNANVAVWSWDLDQATSNQQNPTYDYTVGGMVPVSLWVESSQGCTDDTTIQIEVFPTPNADFNFTNKVCEGQETTLDQVSTLAYGSFDSFDWLIIDDSVTGSGQQLKYTFDSYGTYKVRLTVTSEDGCRDEITKNVPVFETPVAEYTFNNACEDVAINFRDSSDFSGAIDRFTWKFDDGTAWVGEQYPTHSFDTFGVYDVTLIVESHKGCLDSISYPVEVYERVNPRFVAVQDSGCSPFLAELVDNTINQTGTELTYTWTFMDGVSRVDTSYFTYVNESGKAKSYDVRLDIASDKGCFSTYTIEDYLTVLPQPMAYFETDQDLGAVLTTNPVVQFMNKSQQENKIRWYFGDGATSTLQNPSHQFDYEGQYEVTLEAKNYLNCVDSFQMVANVIHENRPFIPSGFTPNGDDLNDFFYIEGLQDVTNVAIDIYDRWGNLIFHGEGKDAKWDGTDMQSRIVQQGVYAYRLVYEDAKGEEFEFQGNVTVLGVNR